MSSTISKLYASLGISQSLSHIISNTQSGIDSITEVYDFLYNLNSENTIRISNLESQIGSTGSNGSNSTTYDRKNDWQDPYLYLGITITGTGITESNWIITRSEIYLNGTTNDITLSGVEWSNRTILNW
jgi:hypothetical protein